MIPIWVGHFEKCSEIAVSGSGLWSSPRLTVSWLYVGNLGAQIHSNAKDWEELPHYQSRLKSNRQERAVWLFRGWWCPLTPASVRAHSDKVSTHNQGRSKYPHPIHTRSILSTRPFWGSFRPWKEQIWPKSEHRPFQQELKHPRYC